MPDTPWAARTVDLRPGLYCRPMVEATGPGLKDMVRHAFELVAMSLLEKDARADAFLDYVTATANLAKQPDADPATLAYLDAAVEEAWSALEAELPSAIRLSLVDACAVGRLLDRTAAGALHSIGQGRGWGA